MLSLTSATSGYSATSTSSFKVSCSVGQGFTPQCLEANSQALNVLTLGSLTTDSDVWTTSIEAQL